VTDTPNAPTPTTPATAKQLRAEAAQLRLMAESCRKSGGSADARMCDNAAAALDAEAARLERETAPPQKYGDHAIARELDRTAQGEAYHGNALYVAKSHPAATDDDRQMLDRWLTGRAVGKFATPDRLALQELAVRIRDSEYHTRLEREAK